MAPRHVVSSRGTRGTRCSNCGWEQIAEQADDSAAHVVWSQYWQRYLCGRCLDRILKTLGKLRPFLPPVD